MFQIAFLRKDIMYHIPEKRRPQESAQLICDGLERCLEEKPFSKIRINDVARASFVSRATFYRLFDSITDVLAYECDRVFAERMRVAADASFASKTEQAVFSAKIWLSHPTLIRAIVENDLYYILFETHAKNAELLKKLYPLPFEDEKQVDYFLSVLSSMICGALAVYFKHGATEPIEEVYKTVCQCADVITETFG